MGPAYPAAVVDTFLTAITGMPTAIFSGLLIVVLGYWLLAAIGQVDIDSLNVDVDADVDVDVDVGGDVAAPTGAHVSAMGILEWLSVGKVPLSLIISVWAIYGWMLGMGGELLLKPALAGIMPAWLYPLLAIVPIILVALAATGWTVRPLRKVFALADAVQNSDLVGRQVTITSRTVDASFGRAVALVTGSEVILDCICREGVSLKRDDQAVVVEYRADRNLYLVAPLPHLQPDFLAATDAPASPAEPAAEGGVPTPPRPASGESA